MNGFVALRVGIKITEAERRQGLRAGLRGDERLLENLLALVPQRIGGIERGLWRIGSPMLNMIEHGAVHPVKVAGTDHAHRQGQRISDIRFGRRDVALDREGTDRAVKVVWTPLGRECRDLQFLWRALDIDVLRHAGAENVLPEWIAELIVEGGILSRSSPGFHGGRT